MEIYGLHDKRVQNILKKFSVLQTNVNHQMKSETMHEQNENIIKEIKL